MSVPKDENASEKVYWSGYLIIQQRFVTDTIMEEGRVLN